MITFVEMNLRDGEMRRLWIARGGGTAVAVIGEVRDAARFVAWCPCDEEWFDGVAFATLEDAQRAVAQVLRRAPGAPLRLALPGGAAH